MATYRTNYAGNTALQEEIWTLSIDECRKLRDWMKKEGILTPGSYWKTVMAPANRAVRRLHPSAEIRTAGFSTGQFGNFLHNAGIGYDNKPR